MTVIKEETERDYERMSAELELLRKLAATIRLYRKKKLTSLRLSAYDLIDEWERKYKDV